MITLLSGSCILIDVDDSRILDFAGYTWKVKDGYLAPGKNHFSDSGSNVFIDGAGDLHLKIENRNGTWYTSEVIADQALGYGRYLFQVAGRIDQLDPQMVLGLFTWDTDPAAYHREIDFEFSRWGDDSATAPNAQYVVQPFDVDGNREQYSFELNDGDRTTHILHWKHDELRFESYHGNISFEDTDSATPIHSWSYAGTPPEPGNAHIRLNLWLIDGMAPQDGTGQEIVIKDFQFSSN